MSDWPMRERSWDAGEDWERSAMGLYLPPAVSPRNFSPSGLPIAIDLFAGVGGFSLGLHLAGYHVVGASDSWDVAAITYLVNLGVPGVEKRWNVPGGSRRNVDVDAGRNLRSVWTIPTEPFPDAHFATFPKALVEPCVKAGTSERGCCPECGAPWERVVEAVGGTIGKGWHDHAGDLARGHRDASGGKATDGTYRRIERGLAPHLHSRRRLRPLHRPGPLRWLWHHGRRGPPPRATVHRHRALSRVRRHGPSAHRGRGGRDPARSGRRW